MCQVGMDFCGGRGRGAAWAAGIWGCIPPKWPENGGRGSGLPGKVKIGTNMIKNNSFKGIRVRIVQGKRVEIDPWRPLDRVVYTPLYSTLLYWCIDFLRRLLMAILSSDVEGPVPRLRRRPDSRRVVKG